MLLLELAYLAQLDVLNATNKEYAQNNAMTHALIVSNHQLTALPALQEASYLDLVHHNLAYHNAVMELIMITLLYHALVALTTVNLVLAMELANFVIPDSLY